VGDVEGNLVGIKDGRALGAPLGCPLGREDGDTFGDREGAFDGASQVELKSAHIEVLSLYNPLHSTEESTLLHP